MVHNPVDCVCVCAISWPIGTVPVLWKVSCHLVGEFEAHSYSEFGGFQEANKSLHRHKPWNPTKSMGL